MLSDDKKYKFINIIVAVFAFVTIVCISVTVTVLMKPLYYWDIYNLDIPELSGISAEICKKNYDILIDYNVIGGSEKLIFSDFAMSKHGEIHFADVKEIFICMQVIAILGLICGIIWFSAVSIKRLRGDIYVNWIRYTTITTIIVALFVALSMIVNWQGTFVAMHKIFFKNNYWLFDPKSDPIITILPDEFFFHCGILTIILIVIQIIALELIYKKVRK